jgi:hypothetical protein
MSHVELPSLIGENGSAPSNHVEGYLWTTFVPKGVKRKSMMPSQSAWHRYFSSFKVVGVFEFINIFGVAMFMFFCVLSKY